MIDERFLSHCGSIRGFEVLKTNQKLGGKNNYYIEIKPIINLFTYSFPQYFGMPNVRKACDVSFLYDKDQYTVKTYIRNTFDHLKLLDLECHFSPCSLPLVCCGIKLDTYNK